MNVHMHRPAAIRSHRLKSGSSWLELGDVSGSTLTLYFPVPLDKVEVIADAVNAAARYEPEPVTNDKTE